MMEKPIIATNIDDLLIKHIAFVEPHKAIWKILIEKTKDKSLEKWIGKSDYFIGVNIAMDNIMPNATREEKTLQVRTWYQEAVIKYIQDNPNCVNNHIAERLKQLKSKYFLALITTNTQKHINKILVAAGLTKLYDEIIASETEKEPDKSELLDTLIEEHGKPKYYLTGKDDPEITEKLKRLKVKIIKQDELDSI
jgi:phosphoglycolate phosphatase-like HAD superfamily hydrolase